MEECSSGWWQVGHGGAADAHGTGLHLIDVRDGTAQGRDHGAVRSRFRGALAVLDGHVDAHAVMFGHGRQATAGGV